MRKFSVSIKKLFSKSTHLWLISQFQCIPYLLYFLLIHHWNHNIYPDLLIIVFINIISINCNYMLSCLVIWQNIENFHFTEHFQCCFLQTQSNKYLFNKLILIFWRMYLWNLCLQYTGILLLWKNNSMWHRIIPESNKSQRNAFCWHEPLMSRTKASDP